MSRITYDPRAARSGYLEQPRRTIEAAMRQRLIAARREPAHLAWLRELARKLGVAQR